MHGLRRKAIFTMLAAVLLICACATSTKRLAEDLKTEGFTIRICREGE